MILEIWGGERKQEDLCVQESNFLHWSLQQLSSTLLDARYILVCFYAGKA